MKTLYTIVTLLISFSAYSQTNINRKTDQGQKTGEWREFHNNGKTNEVLYFVPAKRKMNKAEAFFQGIANYQDTIIYYENLEWREKYEYNENWELKRIVRIDTSQTPVYIYGPNREVSITKDGFYHIDKVGNTQITSVEITNNTGKAIILTSVFNANNIKTEKEKTLFPANKSSTFTFETVLEPDDNGYVVSLKNDSMIIDLSLRTFGYHIESTDIEKEKKLTIEKNFVYYRTGNEALLKLYDKDKKNVLKTVSLAKQKTTIDLNELKAGNYWLCTQDFSTNSQNCCVVKIQK